MLRNFENEWVGDTWEIKVLDHGFVRLVDVMGSDTDIVSAARVSYGKTAADPQKDAELINYLMRHRHTSPFEMCELKFHCKMPIFVARQWVRHRTASLNEYSMRYSEIKDEYYVPKLDRIKGKGKNNKQGSEGDIGDNIKSGFVADCEGVNEQATALYRHYSEGGVANELNRINQPVSAYTEWYWKIDLHNLLHFLKLRLDPHAQYEIRVYAETMAEMVRGLYPVTWQAFEEYVLHSVTFSRKELAQLRELFTVDPMEKLENTDKPEGFSIGEFREFAGKISKIEASI